MEIEVLGSPASKLAAAGIIMVAAVIFLLVLAVIYRVTKY